MSLPSTLMTKPVGSSGFSVGPAPAQLALVLPSAANSMFFIFVDM
jgi:hypothetical protein